MSLAAQLATGKGRWIVALITLFIVAAIFSAGATVGAKLCAGEHAEQENERLKLAQQQLADERVSNQQLAAQLETARNNVRIEYRTIEKEVPRVVTRYIPAPGAPAQDLPACPVTRGFVRVWNDAIAGVSTAAGQPANTAAAADPAASLALADGIGRENLLTNHIQNSEQCLLVRQQLNALIDWHKHTQESLK